MNLNLLQDMLSGRTMRVYVDIATESEKTSIKPEHFLFESLQGEESLSLLPIYTVRVLHHSDKLNLGLLLGKNLTVEILTSAAPRYVGGLITQGRLIGQSDNNQRYFSYELTISPWLWLTTINKEFRIYQNLTVPQIIDNILDTYGFDAEFKLLDNYSPRTYCVQYGESDFTFISRLLEEEGIHYYFQYHQNKQTLIMTDDFITHDKVKGYEIIPYYEHDKLVHVQEEYLSEQRSVESLCSSRYYSVDYNYLAPYRLLNDTSAWPMRQAHHPGGEIFEWPGGYKEDKLGEQYARRRVEELQHKREYFQFNGTIRGLVLGASFQLQNDPRPHQSTHNTLNHDPNVYIVLATHYDLKESPYQSSAVQSSIPSALASQDSIQNKASPLDEQYRCLIRLTAQDKKQPFRPLRLTPKPRTYGPQTAIVVGPNGHEIWTDEHGRVKVQFQWDRYGQEDEHSSCWVRVSSAWASNNFGAIQIPRIGDEVIVDFLNGDPDYPIITGRVYNARNMPPWNLPLNATQMGIYSRTSPDGIYATANALRFEDKKEQEEIYIHAQKDQNIKVKNNYSKRIDMNKIESVGHNKGVEVSNNHYEVVGGDMALFVGPTQKGRFTPPNAQTQQEGLGKVAYGLGTPESTAQGAGSLQLSIENNKLENIGNNHSQLIQNNKSVDVQNNYYLNVADELVITAGKHILLKCGQSVILLQSDGSIQINGQTLNTSMNDMIRLMSEMVKVN